MSRETLRQLRLRGVLTPGKHYRRWGCTQARLEPAASAALNASNRAESHVFTDGRERPKAFLDTVQASRSFS